ncbi:interleukin-12 subunit alpha [Echeneis naucrates]|uniref:interleukin-12 subunit alpha n=1 Tax=Echeneis naucrates TaxID=173247 RepID=UPI001114475E|nr:interleukin-12 subunit alpha-like [Echeneis naucrates]
MANSYFFLAGCALLLTLSWRAATGHPLPTAAGPPCAQCAQLYRRLLLNTAELLSGDVLCYGITSDQVEVSSSETLQTCSPTLAQNSGCMMPRNSSFNESECLRNIMKDLLSYEAAIKSYLRSPLRSFEEEVALLNPTLEIIKSLKNCSLMPNEDNNSSEEAAASMWGNNTYSNRQKVCKMMRGFHIRTITINRAMGYISSREHRK